MKLFLTIAAILLGISFSFGQKHFEKCPKYSVSVDSVLILNAKFEKKLRKRVQKYKPEGKIIILWFNFDYKKRDSVLNFTLLNAQNYGYFHLIQHNKIYGYFTLDSVLFVIDNENVPQYFFSLYENSRILNTAKIDCYSISVGQLAGIECNYKIKTKGNKIKICKQSAFLHKIKQMIVYSFNRFANLFRKVDV